jgi:hypothetical protein
MNQATDAGTDTRGIISCLHLAIDANLACLLRNITVFSAVDYTSCDLTPSISLIPSPNSLPGGMRRCTVGPVSGPAVFPQPGSSTTIVCNPPSWTLTASSALSMTITRPDGGPSLEGQVPFQFDAEWVAISPSFVDRLGGSVTEVEAYGLNPAKLYS